MRNTLISPRTTARTSNGHPPAGWRRWRAGLSVLCLMAVGLAAAETQGPTAATPTPPAETPWEPLFDGKTLDGWKITGFGGRGEVEVKDGRLTLDMGIMLTGVSYTNALPKTDYEVALEAMKVEGSDFFCGLTFPVGESFCTLIVGGWGGGVVGLSSVDGYDAAENETTKYRLFEKKRWYPVRLRVTREKIQVWIDQELMIDQSIVDRNISLRPGEIESSAPFGIAAYQTSAAFRDIKLRRLTR